MILFLIILADAIHLFVILKLVYIIHNFIE